MVKMVFSIRIDSVLAAIRRDMVNGMDRQVVADLGPVELDMLIFTEKQLDIEIEHFEAFWRLPACWRFRFSLHQL